jgi:hypothetical protein
MRRAHSTKDLRGTGFAGPLQEPTWGTATEGSVGADITG